MTNFQVSIANENMVDCKGKVKGLKLQLDNYELSSNVYVVALVGADVVMGNVARARSGAGALRVSFSKNPWEWNIPRVSVIYIYIAFKLKKTCKMPN